MFFSLEHAPTQAFGIPSAAFHVVNPPPGQGAIDPLSHMKTLAYGYTFFEQYYYKQTLMPLYYMS